MGDRESQSRNHKHSHSHSMGSNLTLDPSSNTQGAINQCNNRTMGAPPPHRNHNRRIGLGNSSQSSIPEGTSHTHLCSNRIYLRLPRMREGNNNTRSNSRIRQHTQPQRLDTSSPILRYPLRLVFPRSPRHRRFLCKKRTVMALPRLLAITRPWGPARRSLMTMTVGPALPLFTSRPEKAILTPSSG